MNFSIFIASFIQITLLSFLLLSGVSCALYTPDSGKNQVITTCNVPTDQSGTVSGHWQVTPIPMAFHQNDFQSNEISSMINAVSTWNNFFTASKNIKTLDGSTTDNPRLSTATNPAQSGPICDHGLVQGKSFSGNVVIYKLGQWPSAYPASAIALTSFCSISSQPYPAIYMALMEINYQNFFIEGQKNPDLESIVLHELGHLHGLNHSCEVTNKTGTPNCKDPNIDPSYLSASMYPSFSFDTAGMGEQRRSLGSNDESRANCLY